MSCRQLQLALLLLVVMAISLSAEKAKHKDPDNPLLKAPYPDAVLIKIRGERFRNPDYFHLFAGDAILASDPKAIFGRQKAAAEARESYKALFFARIFTSAQPELAIGWSNRAALANALGLHEEAAACQMNSEHPTQRILVPLGILPRNGLSVKPSSLADWAAALFLVSDGLSQKEGGRAVLAVRDDVSGIKVATPREVQDRNKSRTDADLPPVGPWATSQPLNLGQVLPNSFSLRSGDPMKHHTVSGGGMFAAMLLSAASGMNSDPTAAAAGAKAAGEMAGRASNVASEYQGGSYVTATYKDGHEVVSTDAPKPTGATETVGSPAVIFWGSGNPGTASYLARVLQRDKVYFRTWTAATVNTNVRGERSKLPEQLYFPKLMSICPRFGMCTSPVTLNELLLTSDDLVELSPNLVSSAKSLDGIRADFENLTLKNENGGDLGLIAFDASGTVYTFNLTPTIMLVPPKK